MEVSELVSICMCMLCLARLVRNVVLLLLGMKYGEIICMLCCVLLSIVLMLGLMCRFGLFLLVLILVGWLVIRVVWF